jgi:hypothetical protein
LDDLRSFFFFEEDGVFEVPLLVDSLRLAEFLFFDLMAEEGLLFLVLGMLRKLSEREKEPGAVLLLGEKNESSLD